MALRPPEAILADAVPATGGAAAWNAHKTLHFKMETTLQGMGMGGTGERFETRGDKSLTIMEMTGLGRVREGNNGKVFWTQDPVQGIRYLEGVEAEQTRIASSWNVDMHAGELFVKLESATETGPDGAALECVVATPKLGSPAAQLLRRQDPPSSVTDRSARKPAGRHAFSRRHPRLARGRRRQDPVREQHPARPDHDRRQGHGVTFDEPMDDKMFDPPKPGGTSPAPPRRRNRSSAWPAR